jgi:predicted DNA binding protein
MPFFETRVRVQHPCPFCDLSVRFPQAHMALWCNLAGEVLHVEATSPQERDAIKAAVGERLGLEGLFEEEGDAFTVTRTCKCDRSKAVSAVAERLGLWILQPITMHGGFETYRFVSSGPDEIRMFVEQARALGDVEVISHRQRARLDEVHNVDFYPAHLFDGLTERQMRAVVIAHEHGLLNVPSEASLEEVAAHEGLSRSTFGEHLRKAQQRLVANAYPFMKLHLGASAPRPQAARRPAEQGAVGGK